MEPCSGLQQKLTFTLSLSTDVIENLQSEEDLESFIKKKISIDFSLSAFVGGEDDGKTENNDEIGGPWNREQRQSYGENFREKYYCYRNQQY